MLQPFTPEAAFATIASVLRNLCKDPLPDLALDTRLDELPGMDSLKSLHALALMEEQFGVEIDVAVLDYHLEQVQDVVHAVCAACDKSGLGAGRSR
ncbi:MAG: acyl carrier protein [Rhodopila sp.]|nr:acyl carrier protein [Rhodopila sp.]